jgi:hypothetical protein
MLFLYIVAVVVVAAVVAVADNNEHGDCRDRRGRWQ